MFMIAWINKMLAVGYKRTLVRGDMIDLPDKVCTSLRTSSASLLFLSSTWLDFSVFVCYLSSLLINSSCHFI